MPASFVVDKLLSTKRGVLSNLKSTHNMIWILMVYPGPLTFQNPWVRVHFTATRSGLAVTTGVAGWAKATVMRIATA